MLRALKVLSMASPFKRGGDELPEQMLYKNAGTVHLCVASSVDAGRLSSSREETRAADGFPQVWGRWWWEGDFPCHARSMTQALVPTASEPSVKYDSGMTKKIAISLPDGQYEQILVAVEGGVAKSVSGYVSAALAAYSRRSTLEDLLDDLDAELGPVSSETQEWAKEALGW